MYNVHHKIERNGFTLIEIIASIAILGMVIAVFLPMLPQIMSWNNNSEQKLVAGNLLEQAIHDIKQDQSIITSLEGKSIPKCSSSYQIGTELPTYKINGISHSVVVNVCQSDKEARLGLYRANIQISSPKGNSSESYTYLHGDVNE